MANIIKLEKVNKVYGKTIKTHVLKDINLSFDKGEYCAIIGQSGSGKSTLLNMIGALDRPTTGNIIIEDQAISNYGDNDLAKFRNQTMGFVFQFHYLLPEFTVLENVLIPYWIRYGKKDKETEEKAKEMIERVGVGDRMYNKSTDISGGQQQRIAIARALIMQPKIILADEPTGNLDSKSGADINKLLRQINQEFSTTFIIVTHDQRIADQCDRIVEITDGAITSDILTKNAKINSNEAKENK